MTVKENDTILELSVTADQMRDVLSLLISHYFEGTPFDETSRMCVVNGYAQIQNVLSLVEHQASTIARTLDDLAGIEPASGESA